MSQSGIFNVLDYGLTTTDSGSVNHDKLQDLVNNFLSSTGPTSGFGGTISFPSVGTFKIKLGTKYPTAEIDINKGDVSGASLIFAGTGQQTPSSPNISKEDAGDLFVVQNNPGHDENVGGITFQDLLINYGTGITSGAAIRLNDAPGTSAASQNVRIFRVVFRDCPTAVNFHSCLQCSMLECTVVSAASNGNSQNGVIFGGFPTSAIETYIAGCRFLTSNDNQTAMVVNNTEHLRIMNTRVEGWQVGISFKPQGQSYRNHFENVSVRESTASSTALAPALLIQPQSGGSVAETAFVNCEFAPGDNSGSTKYTLGGVYIDATNGTVDTIHFVSCTSVNWLGPGCQIVTGTNIELLGGYYSCNGQGTGTESAGIYISGSASGVRIIGCSCTNSYFSNGADLPKTQSYGIAIATGAQNIFVRDCDLTGNNTQGLTAAASLSNVQVANCANYNDQANLIRSTAPGSGVIFSPAGYGYYGPAAFYVSGGSVQSVNVSNNNSGLTSGAFTIGPVETASIFYTATPNFLMIGM